MHAQHAFLPLWDDHEFRNNYSKDNWSLPELFFQEKKSAAWHAWFERMPVPRYADDMTRTYRSLQARPDRRVVCHRQPSVQGRPAV